MAMVDYGAILFKNGVFQNRDQFFMDMQDSVGWVDRPRIKYDDCDCKTEIGDCKGNKIINKRIDGNYFVYAGDNHFTAAFYKTYSVFCLDEIKVKTVWGCQSDDGINHRSLHFKIGEVNVHIKEINYNVFECRFTYKENQYLIIYGYGIDTDMDVWDRTKNHYLAKKAVKKIDSIFARYKI